MSTQFIRNFSIIAHIDHGKSTLADGLLEKTGSLSDREKKSQFLDNMDLERERGITIKAQTVRLFYKDKTKGKSYQLNLIDTPGHVDFSYEVSRSLAACEGALLVVDAAQGVEAQTVANAYLAIENNLEILPVLNKMDLPSANPELVKEQIEKSIGLDTKDILFASAKEKEGFQDILETIIQKIPPPPDGSQNPLRALVFDSWFDVYQGVVLLCRIMDGKLKQGDDIQLMNGGGRYEVLKIGVFSPFTQYLTELKTGEVGFIICGIRNIKEIQVGETLTHVQKLGKKAAQKALPGFRRLKPMVFSGLFPVETKDYKFLKEALEKLTLNDSSFVFEPETSSALGYGFRSGFLGLLHMEVTQERLEREFNLNLISTFPSVVYQVQTTDGEKKSLSKPSELPEKTKIQSIFEPFVKVTLHSPSECLGGLLKLCQEKRGTQIKMDFISEKKILLEYELPMNEMIIDFYDQLKTLSKGYASLEYEYIGHKASHLVKMDILLNGESVDALSLIIHKEKADFIGRRLVKKLKELIPKQQYQVAIQAAIHSKIIARETLSALRKDVTAKLYGGDVTRKKKLLEKQKAGKKRMKQIGKVSIPQEAFLALLQMGQKKEK